jgi:hypothetical protein
LRAAVVEDRLAAASFVAIVPENSREDFVRRAEQFAVDRSFTIKTSPTRPGGKHIVLQMWRGDVDAILINPFHDSTEFRLYFYLTATSPTSSHFVDELAADFKEAVDGIPGCRASSFKIANTSHPSAPA